MRKILLYITAALALGTGCKKTYDDTIQGKKPDERISAALADYQKKLSGAPYGWIFIESTTGTAYNQGVSASGPKAVFAYYMQFNDSNQVTMFSDFDISMASTPKTSSFRLKALQRPVLIFDTYTYLHVPGDPNPAISKSPFGTGFGWGTDFEYSFSDSIAAANLGDTIHLIGNLNQASGSLIKATKAQRDAYYSGQLATAMQAFGNIKTYFKQASSGGNVLFEMTPALGANASDFNWLDGSGNLKSASTSFYYTAGQVNFVTPVTIGNQTIKGISDISWDPGTSTISASINGSAVSIAGAIAPLKNDLNAPFNWWNASVNSKSYYYSNNGYHAFGADDYFGVSKLANWWYMLYWAKYSTAGYDAFAGVVNGSLNGQAVYTPDPPPATSTTKSTFTADGKIIFKSLGAFGSGTSVFNTSIKTLIINPNGHYLVLKQDGKTWDMVSASDATSWIRWSPWWNR